jgi:hypothetical protein
MSSEVNSFNEAVLTSFTVLIDCNVVFPLFVPLLFATNTAVEKVIEPVPAAEAVQLTCHSKFSITLVFPVELCDASPLVSI